MHPSRDEAVELGVQQRGPGWLLVARGLRCCMHRGEGVASEGGGWRRDVARAAIPLVLFYDT